MTFHSKGKVKYCFREAAKKVLFFSGRAGPGGGGGGGGGVIAWPLKKELFLNCWQGRCFLTSLMRYLAKNMALLVQKFC